MYRELSACHCQNPFSFVCSPKVYTGTITILVLFMQCISSSHGNKLGQILKYTAKG